jgi:hypothetical protein
MDKDNGIPPTTYRAKKCKNTTLKMSFIAHEDHHTRHDEENWKIESLRSFVDGVSSIKWDKQSSYGFEEDGSPKAERRAMSSSPQLRRRDSGISEADSVEERGDDNQVNAGDNISSILHKTFPGVPSSPQSPLLHSEGAPEMVKGPERRIARVEDMYGAHHTQKPSELDITLSPPSPGGKLKRIPLVLFKVIRNEK